MSVKSILESLSSDEQQEFTLWLQKKNRRGDTKNLVLLKLLQQGVTHELDVQLYGKSSKNAYHALRKRLQDSLLDFIATKSFAAETSEELEILKLLLASRIFFEQKQYNIGFKTLEKAEKLALQLDVYSILNEIYYTKIEYAHLNPRWILKNLITASDQNLLYFNQEFHLNKVYAAIKEQLKNPLEHSINNIINTAFTDFDLTIDNALTYKSLFKLMSITVSFAKLQSDYHSISNFMIAAYDIISQKKNLADKHLHYHLEILNLMAVTSFRNKDFTTAMAFVTKMETELQKNPSYRNRFLEKVTTIKVLNLNYTNRPTEALVLLENHKKESLDLSLIHIMCLFQQGNYASAYTVYRTLTHSDVWYQKKMGMVWVLKKNIIEILLLIEMDKLDLVLLRLSSFKQRFYAKLKAMEEHRVLRFMNLVNSYYENPKAVTTFTFKQKVETSFEWIGAKREDIFVMSFYAWLKAKMEGANVYATTLELVSKT